MTRLTRLTFASCLLAAAACGEVEPTQPDAPTIPIDAPLPCEPNTTVCSSNLLTVCGPDGIVQREETCALGCASSNDRCTLVLPSNNLASHLDMAASAPDIVLAASGQPTTINADTGDVIHMGSPFTIPSTVVTQTGAPSIRVFRVKSLAIRNRLNITGAAAIAFVSAGDVEIAAYVQVAARNDTRGPGAHATCTGTNIAANTTALVWAGGGGGGFGGAGSSGGTARRTNSGSVTETGGAGSAATGTPDLVPLRGGCKGGNINSSSPTWSSAIGGGGGGALQVVSGTRITVTTAGIIDAGGGGAGYGEGGAGGGSGGGVLLEAPTVTVDGTLAANGGSGGCYRIDGEDGQVAYRNSSLAAIGSNCNEAGFIGDGGHGGTKDGAPTNGGSITYSGTATGQTVFGGGGAGAVGRIRVNTASGTFTMSGTSLVSPLASSGPLGTR